MCFSLCVRVSACVRVCVRATDASQGEAAEVLDNRSLEEILSSIPPPPPPAMTNEPGAPRLMITHLVNRNFKSYAGEQILGPFHKVRPNMVTSLRPRLGNTLLHLMCEALRLYMFFVFFSFLQCNILILFFLGLFFNLVFFLGCYHYTSVHMNFKNIFLTLQSYTYIYF